MSGALAFAALALALGATDDEVPALWNRLGPAEAPWHPADAISDLRRALDEIRGNA
jgi:hypothetical protein